MSTLDPLPNLAEVSLTPIAYVRSCYPERFGIPRQAGLVESAKAVIVFPNTDLHWHALRGIDGFSHIWVIFLFHGQTFTQFRPLVRPPRLGGNKTMGVYATRSPNRPNQIGLSAVPLDQVEQTEREILLHIHGGDFLDRTPVLDIKPYVTYADAIATATSTWANTADPLLPVVWSPEAMASLTAALGNKVDDIFRVITDVIAQDPRPGYERKKDGQPGQKWNMRLAGFDIFWKVEAGIATVTQLFSMSSPNDAQS
ncbi:tRNA (N6-threonylcarbamoyladenosine(37)-N6)-methyltransferase TrmO [Acaryochloris sp. IP29b_bin.137]|uniref:tRNA (N6-threonylcarbamoyladenosine(37)-N6)-methyltransferase TrmO n=1 Tax=Acaryochloris sp. IP29b_bin.137 TaxID=2969217 RepID=UPI0026165C98|nr:tRNA (N6-threonylcarbamoyladenosine(37)-N6)-methyltransferase TrmO [Acaryochloris sp. IP29b_bin.137]